MKAPEAGRWPCAQVAATALTAGGSAPAQAFLAAHGWSFAADEVLTTRLLTHLERRTPLPSARALAVSRSEGPSRLPDEAPRAFRERAWQDLIATPGGAVGAEDRLTCTLEHLAFLGRELAEDRRRWVERTPPADPRDAETARLFAGFAAEAYPAGIQSAWEALFLPDAAAAFLAEAEAGRENRKLRRELVDSFFLLCLGPPGEPPIWRRIHARVVEQGPEGPVNALAARIPPALHPAVAHAMVTQGSRADSAMVAFPFRGEALRSRAALAAAFDHPDGIERLLDFHVVIRLLTTWRHKAAWSPEASWGVVTQNRGRARSRLRAVLAGLPQVPEVPVPGFYQRTRIAVMRFFRDLARDWRHRGFAMGHDTRVDGPCRLVAPTLVDPAEHALLRTFVLRGLLLGHHDTLKSWIPTGNGGGRTGFYRYLDHDLPAELADRFAPPGVGGRRDYQHLRLALQNRFDGLLTELEPVLLAVAALTTPVAPARLHAILHPTWHPAVPLPQARLGGCVAAARQALEKRGDI